MLHCILPKRLNDGNFGSWLQYFERCALTNSWDDAKHLAMLPAFLQGPAATYCKSLPTDRRDTIVYLSESLLPCFSPLVDRERHYRQFEEMTLGPPEDPTLFMWCLKDCLRRAEPDLSDPAFDALLHRQFLRALPSGLKMKLWSLIQLLPWIPGFPLPNAFMPYRTFHAERMILLHALPHLVLLLHSSLLLLMFQRLPLSNNNMRSTFPNYKKEWMNCLQQCLFPRILPLPPSPSFAFAVTRKAILLEPAHYAKKSSIANGAPTIQPSASVAYNGRRILLHCVWWLWPFAGTLCQQSYYGPPFTGS